MRALRLDVVDHEICEQGWRPCTLLSHAPLCVLPRDDLICLSDAVLAELDEALCKARNRGKQRDDLRHCLLLGKRVLDLGQEQLRTRQQLLVHRCEHDRAKVLVRG